ncbi:FAD assembly factor SdhE [Rhodovulum strictum]|uniref:FAD assembly factor SdhE n=1 Tax=Rhodovulum strictum TaxID=58314 RepID=A0A844BDN4_9RHOB|nr:succinate dehydrogenase assembly factor 2 [Rhodovulum strictum]MRH19365.1 succinate dehydrogenase assembly factor 2 [Rhodovulum strictum]
MSETIEARRKRMSIRAWRRGTREMDLILGGYADAHLAAMDGPALDAFDALLAEDDHDLYQWVTGQSVPPARLAVLVGELAARTAV